MACDRTPIEGALCDLQPVRIEPLREKDPDLALFRFLLQAHHYLGLRNSVGENLKYLVRDRQGRPVACLLFGAAAAALIGRRRLAKRKADKSKAA